MANMKDVVQGLKFLIRGLDFKLTGTAGPPNAKNRLAKYSLHHLEGVSCPHCEGVGTLVKIIPDQKQEVGRSHTPEGIEGRDQIDADTFDLISNLTYDFPTGLNLPQEGRTMDDIARAQANREEQVKAQSPGWICFECAKGVQTVEFIRQLENA